MEKSGADLKLRSRLRPPQIHTRWQDRQEGTPRALTSHASLDEDTDVTAALTQSSTRVGLGARPRFPRGDPLVLKLRPHRGGEAAICSVH